MLWKLPFLSHQHGLRKILPWHFPADQQHLHKGGVWSQRWTGELCKCVCSEWAVKSLSWGTALHCSYTGRSVWCCLTNVWRHLACSSAVQSTCATSSLSNHVCSLPHSVVADMFKNTPTEMHWRTDILAPATASCPKQSKIFTVAHVFSSSSSFFSAFSTSFPLAHEIGNICELGKVWDTHFYNESSLRKC